MKVFFPFLGFAKFSDFRSSKSFCAKSTDSEDLYPSAMNGGDIRLFIDVSMSDGEQFLGFQSHCKKKDHTMIFVILNYDELNAGKVIQVKWRHQ